MNTSLSGDDFSVLIGERQLGEIEPEKEEKKEKPKPAGKKEEKKPVKKEPKAKKKESRQDLLRKKEELELFLHSLEDAHEQSKFPEYTYERLKKRNELELARVNKLIDGKPADIKKQPGESAKEAPKATKPIKKETGQPDMKQESHEEKIKENIDNKVGGMESFINKIPHLKSQITGIKTELSEYDNIMNEIKSNELVLARELTAIKKQIKSLGLGAKRKGKKGKGKPKGINDQIVDLSKRMDFLSGKMESIFNQLKTRVDQLSVIEEVENVKRIKDLKKTIEQFKTELKDFVKKDELGKLVLRPVVDTLVKIDEKRPGKQEKAKKTNKSDVIVIDDLKSLVGKEVTIEPEISLIKSVEEKNMSMYWYKIKDETAESILTCRQRILKKRAKIKGIVKKTKTGSIYLSLTKLL